MMEEFFLNYLEDATELATVLSQQFALSHRFLLSHREFKSIYSLARIFKFYFKMNDVPVLFFEGVVSHFFFKEELSAGSALAGSPGLVASDAYAKRCFQDMIVRNGQLVTEQNYNCEDQPVNINSSNKKHLHYTGIAIRADKETYSTDPEAMERVLSATKGKHVILSLKTPNISEEIAKCVESIQLVFELQVDTKITSDVLQTMRLCVEKNTLNIMDLAEDFEIEDETTQLLVDLLKQKQFHQILLPGKCSAAIKKIIASWRENSEEMVGKTVYCRAEFSELQLSPTEFPFEECTEEEERDAKRAYYLVKHWPKFTAKLMLKTQDGRAVFCFSRRTSDFKTSFVFA